MARIINVDMLIILIQERPEIWDQRDPNYANRAVKQAAWRSVCGSLFPQYDQQPRAAQRQIMDDVTTRWRSIRDQYRRERQQREKSGAGAPPKKKKYIYFDRLTFLNPSMDLRPTQSNLTDRETGSDSEQVIDPVGDGEEVAGPSAAPSIPPGCSSSGHPAPAAAEENTEAPQFSSSAAAPAPSQDDPGNSSSPTVALDRSQQAAVRPQRARRRRELLQSRRNVDAGVMNYLARVREDDGEEGFTRSLAQYLRSIERELRLRLRGCFQILIDACTPPNNPYNLMQMIEQWQMSPENILRPQRLQGLHAQQGSEAPPPRQPTPPPQPTNNQQWQPQHHIAGYQHPSQHGHLSTPSAGGWTQPGFGQYGHFGLGYDSRTYGQQHLGYLPNPGPTHQSGQHQSRQNFPQATITSTQAAGQLGLQRPPDADPDQSTSPLPTYQDL
ncbi:uncharacterized protein [Ranitomeya imitator]|uniref:uncharacterized protein n=1 Tax=Ranitomeya imitator TaxID=111125 RepID=UPI0037E80D3C